MINFLLNLFLWIATIAGCSSLAVNSDSKAVRIAARLLMVALGVLAGTMHMQ